MRRDAATRIKSGSYVRFYDKERCPEMRTHWHSRMGRVARVTPKGGILLNGHRDYCLVDDHGAYSVTEAKFEPCERWIPYHHVFEVERGPTGKEF